MTFLGDGYALCSHYRTCKSAEQASAAVSVATATSSSRDGAEATANFTNEDSPFIHRLDGQSSQSPVIGRPLIQPGPRMDGKGIECNLADAIKSKLPANDDLNTTNNLSINYSDINQITNINNKFYGTNYADNCNEDLSTLISVVDLGHMMVFRHKRDNNGLHMLQ